MEDLEKLVQDDMEGAEAKIRAELAKRGFGILTEIDVAATLKAKLGVERPALKILGACNPGFANRALEIDRDVALFMPCNVVLEQVDGGVRVSAMDPSMMMTSPSMETLAQEATALLSDALKAI